MKTLSTAKTVKDTLQCICCADESLGVLKPRFRVGTTSGARDEPISGALKQKLYADMETCSVDWVICPSDNSAITAMLNAGLIDVVMAPTEDAMVLVHGSKSLRICGTFAGSKHTWRLFKLPALQGKPRRAIRRLGVPDFLCASLMACLLQDWGCFGGETPPEIVIIGSFVEALHLMVGSRTVQALLWECKADELKAARTVCVEALAPVPTPWLSHLFICGRETLFTKSGTIKQFFNFSNELCAELLTTEFPSTQSYMIQHYGCTDEDVKLWTEGAAWSCSSDVDWVTVMRPAEYLGRLNMLDGSIDEFVTSRLVAPGCRVLGGPAPEPPRVRPKEGRPVKGKMSILPGPAADSSDYSVDMEEGAGVTIASSHSHQLLPEHTRSTVVNCTSPEEILRTRNLTPSSLRVPKLPHSSSTAASSSSRGEPVPAG